MTPSSDRHRQRCYDAEASAFGGTTLDRRIGWDDLVALFEAVTRHPWWLSLGAAPPALRPARRDAARSSADGATIRIASGDRTALTLGHELCHHLVCSLRIDDPGHGPAFRAAELRVIELLGGKGARQQLDEAWRRHGLDLRRWPGPEPHDGGPGLATSLTAAAPGRLRGAVPLSPSVIPDPVVR